MVMHVVYFSSGKRVLISQNGVILKLVIVLRLATLLRTCTVQIKSNI